MRQVLCIGGQGGLLITLPPLSAKHNSQGERCGLIRRLWVFTVGPRRPKYRHRTCTWHEKSHADGWARVVVLHTEHVIQATRRVHDSFPVNYAADGIIIGGRA